MTAAFFIAASPVAILLDGAHGHHPDDAVHALLYLHVSLLAVAVIFFILGAPFVAALEVIIYAGAIMVLFIFVVMMLNLGPAARRRRRPGCGRDGWCPPSWRGAAGGGADLAPAHRGHRPPRTAAVDDPNGSGHGALRPLRAGGGAGLDAAPGGTGGRLPPRTSGARCMEGRRHDNDPHGARARAGRRPLRPRPDRAARAPQHHLHAHVHRDHAERRRPGLRGRRRPLGPGSTDR